MRGLIIFIFLLSHFSAKSQTHQHCNHNFSDTVFPDVFFQKNTNDFKDPVITAATAFNELKDVKIEIRRKGIKTMMAARPKLNFLFRNRENREYVILITNHEEMNANAMYANMSSCAQVGVIGHELSHILSYEDMTNMELLWFGIKYVFNKKEIEAETDLLAIRKGFGQQIIEFNKYLYKSPEINKKYLRKKQKFYLSSTEIEQKMMENL